MIVAEPISKEGEAGIQRLIDELNLNSMDSLKRRFFDRFFPGIVDIDNHIVIVPIQLEGYTAEISWMHVDVNCKSVIALNEKACTELNSEEKEIRGGYDLMGTLA